MGNLYYGGGAEPIRIPDRLLAHIKVVIATKLRRGESFTLTWRDGTGRSTIWLQPAIELRFVFASPEPEMLDPELMKHLANEAAGTAGIMVDLSEASTVSPTPAPRA
ncbi:hypothetical protein [Microbacterium sp. 10M-3C3]|uniref:DUF7882 family protein n=1 Tax=Microbacterium sp. 10M-3C3 TaxID=2483401 RepID=UPI000F6383B6|nr:hypothetical protein [Microbacterium sp. 10M-3C3]